MALLRSLLGTWLLLGGLYAAYARFITPRIETSEITSPDLTVVEKVTQERPVDHLELAKTHLPNLEWLRLAKYQIQIGNMYLYAQEYERRGSNSEVRFRPFAVIWKKPGEKEPLTATSESASVRFSEALDIHHAKPGRVQNAMLEGSVEIKGPNGLLIQGRTFSFSEVAGRLWTDRETTLQFGEFHARGIGMQVELVPIENATSLDESAFSGIRSVTLRRKIIVRYTPRLQKKPSRIGLKPGDPVIARADGPLTFSFSEKTLNLERNVQVRQEQQGGYLDCDALEIGFKPDPVAKPVEKSVQNQWLPGAMVIEKFIARGSSETPLRAGVPEKSVSITGNSLSYLLEEREIELKGAPGIFDYQKSHLESPQLEAIHTETQDLQTLNCQGPGLLRTVDERGQNYSITWKKSLEKKIEKGYDIIDVHGLVTIKSPPKAVLEAEHVKLWMLPEARASRPGDRKKTKSKSYSPERLLAEYNVALVTPQLEGQTDRLEVWFRVVEFPSVAQVNDGPEKRGKKDPSNKQGANDSQAKSPPLFVKSDRIQAQVLRDLYDAERLELSDLRCDGAVHLTQTVTPQEKATETDSKLPELIEFDAQRLVLHNKSGIKQKVDLFGTPATIKQGDQHLEGGHIEFDRAKNKMTVHGTGKLLLPVSSAMIGKQLDQELTLEINWNEKLEFNGEVATFFDQIHCQMEDSSLECQTMVVELSRPVSFVEPNREDLGKPEVRKISCKDGVKLYQQEYLGERMVAIRRAQMAEFSANRETGKIEGQGPGTVWMWRREEKQRAGLTVGSVAKANRPLKPDQANWEFTRVRFDGKMKGSMNDRYATFGERVLIVYGPVKATSDEIDPDALPPGAGWMQCDELQIQHYQKANGREDYITALASGNVDLTGKIQREQTEPLFDAQADTITFDQSKGLYILKSLGSHKARISLQDEPGANRRTTESQRIEFNPGTGHIRSYSTLDLELLN